MLTPLDDTLRHQLGTTFDHAGTSDPRFFDRYWFAIYDPAGNEPMLNTGMCAYLNMNVLDGYAAIISDGQQHNIRMSRQLRPSLFTEDPNVHACGPLRMSVVEPFKVLRLQLEPNDHSMAFDLEWKGVLSPHEELPNFSRVRGRINQDYLRYNQTGIVDGWIEVGGVRTEVKDWWGGRDHSWGVRTDVAGGEPETGVDPPRGAVGTLWTWLTFGTSGPGGHVQLQEVDEHPTHVEAMLRWPDDARPAVIADDVTLDFTVHPGTRRFDQATYHLRVDRGPDAGVWDVVMEPISRSLAMKGLGYSLGYSDNRGFGVWRGEYHEEYDRYDVSDPEDVVMPDGTVERPYHRDCAVTLKVVSPSGESWDGAGHCAILPIGPSSRNLDG